MKIIEYPANSDLEKLLERPYADNTVVESAVQEVLASVKEGGDKALLEFTRRFDQAEISSLAVSSEEVQQAEHLVPQELKEAINTARSNIEKFHALQKEESIKVETSKSVQCWRKSLPIQKVGLYIPGGSAPLFSTILMLAVPAKLAGCREIILCTPPSKDGSIHPAILYTAKLTGISKLFKVGGAQAIAAMTYGTESIPSVYKIFGPGNQYVTTAKQMVSREGVAIDMPAGPSEVAVIADESANPVFVAADLLSQAEHGPDSQVVLISDSKTKISEILDAVHAQLEQLPRKSLAEKALDNSKAILINDMTEAMLVSNAYAPEHLILQVKNPEALADMVTDAGSVFLGHYTPEAAGDYASGTNHTLPTNGYARAYSGVSLDSFVKKVTFQHITEAGIQALGPAIELMAEAEQLDAHKNAVTVRLKHLKQG
ncbi:histidinol dehydrogenase [Cytophagaceae bacterium ABcell3]|nr:histidinol dehydrogenase [Cytophagaceae bacterium ABcell3]